MRVIGIETSCDETAVAVYDAERGLLSHRLHSQIAVHQAYGGVVPEIASRDHVKWLLPLVRGALADADSSPQSIDGVAYTAGPGLIGALLVGDGALVFSAVELLEVELAAGCPACPLFGERRLLGISAFHILWLHELIRAVVNTAVAVPLFLLLDRWKHQE